MRRLALALSIAAAPAALAAPAAEPRPIAPEAVPAELAPAVARGDAAIDLLRDRVLKRVNALLAQGGPIAALTVCPTEAPRIAREVSEVHQVELGRTSHRIRNPANAPRRWAAAAVAAGAGKKASEVSPAVFDLGDRVGLLRPIPTMPSCARCHGPPESIDPAVKAELARRYPKDQGTGFAPGDLRGFYWAEVRKP